MNSLRRQHLHDAGVYLLGLADEAQIEHALRVRFGIALRPGELEGDHQIAVLARYAAGMAA